MPEEMRENEDANNEEVDLKKITENALDTAWEVTRLLLLRGARIWAKRAQETERERSYNEKMARRRERIINVFKELKEGLKNIVN